MSSLRGFVVAALVAGCAGSRPSGRAGGGARDEFDLTARREGLNVVVVSLDAVRYDRTGLAPGGAGRTPNLSRFAERAVVFHDAVSAAPWTVPSHLAIWTGRWPTRHGVVNKLREVAGGPRVDAVLDADIPTFPERLCRLGWNCVAFTGGAGVSARFGYGRGFTRYLDDRRFAGFEYSMPPAVEWLRAHRGERFFMFLHGYDAHGQHALEGVEARSLSPEYRGALDGSVAEQGRYREQMLTAIDRPGAPASLRGVLTEADGRFLRDVYDRKIASADERLGSFLRELDALGLADRTIVAVIADHGEEFMEHDALDHGHTLYQEQLHVPMLLRVPGATRRRDVASTVRTIDLFPTLFDALGLAAPDGADGESLLPLLRGTTAGERAAFAETDYRLYVHHRMVRRGRYKLVLDLSDGETGLFDLEADPGERRDLSAQRPAERAALESTLSAWMSRLHTDPRALHGRREAPITVY